MESSDIALLGSSQTVCGKQSSVLFRQVIERMILHKFNLSSNYSSVTIESFPTTAVEDTLDSSAGTCTSS